MRARRTMVAVAVSGLLLTGCQGDADTEPRPDGSSPSVSQSPSSSVSPASGKVMEVPAFRVNMPEGWEIDAGSSIHDIQVATDTESFSNNTLYVTYYGEAKAGADLSYVADLGLDTFGSTVRDATRVDDVQVAGETAYHLVGTTERGARSEEFGVLYGGSEYVAVTITLDGPAAERQRVVDSVLASWEWTGEGP